MELCERIEPESETQRTHKALRIFVPSAQLPLERGAVEIQIDAAVAAAPGGQRLLVMLVHLLARMKGMISSINLQCAGDQHVCTGVPLRIGSLGDGLDALVTSLSGARSQYRCEFSVGGRPVQPDARVALGSVGGDADVRLASNAWCALTGDFVGRADWTASCPIGPYLAGCFGAAEVFKHLVAVNFGPQTTPPLGSVALSLFDFSRDADANPGDDIRNLGILDLSVAGAGAGGTAALYTLAAIEGLHGEAVVVDPGLFKHSSLGRYLMSNHDQVYASVMKTCSVETFFKTHSPNFYIQGIPEEWGKVQRPWGLTVCTVDTREARLDVQRSGPRELVEAGVLNGTLYAVLRVVPEGWCLECKHPYDPEGMLKRRALTWGISVEEVKEREREQLRVSRADLERLAIVQGKAIDNYLALEGMPFDEVPAVTECEEGPLKVDTPSQAAVLPFATTAAGVVLAGEVLKSVTKRGRQLSNYFVHDLRYRLKKDALRFKKRLPNCPGCSVS